MSKTHNHVPRPRRHWRLFAAGGLAAFLAFGPIGCAAEPIKIGVLLTTGTGPVFIAKEKGYFAAEAFDAEMVNFEAGPLVAVAAVSG